MVNDYVYVTFQEAAKKRGLLENDTQLTDCLNEACLTITDGHELRSFFVLVIENCQPSDIRLLWERFRDQLSKDILKKYQQFKKNRNLTFNQSIYDTCLHYINRILIQSQKQTDNIAEILTYNESNIINFNDQNEINSNNKRNRLINDELNFDIEQQKIEFENNQKLLNDEQKIVLDNVVERVNNENIGKYL